MRTYTFPLAAVLALTIAASAHAAGNPSAKQENRHQSQKVWTNDDMDQLRAEGLISIVGPEPTGTPAPAEVAPSQPALPVYNSRLEDPEWYAQKAADLRAQLDKRQAALQQEQTAMADAVDRITQPGVALNEPSVGVTPDAALAVLEAQVDEVQSELDDLGDLARQNNIPPGVLRG